MHVRSSPGSLAMSAALLALTGCSVYFKDVDASGVKVTTATRPFTSNPGDGLDTYWNLRWTKDDGAYDAIFDWDMVGDYRVDATGGFVSAQNALDFGAGGSYGVRLDAMGSNPAKSYELRAEYLLPGTMVMTALVREGTSENVLGTLNLPMTFYGDYSIRNTGGNLEFHGRAHGASVYQLIGQTPSPPAQEVLCVHYFAFGFPKGAELALDDYNIHNGTLPGSPGPAEFVQHRMRQIQSPLYDAWSRIDAYPRDISLAKSFLLAAQSEHFLYLGQLSANFKRPGPKAYAKVQTTLKHIADAIAQIESGAVAASEKGRQKVLKTISKAIKSDVGALKIVDTLR